mmetsp:Transcript_43384/g.97922  ORF Transcript_43384/g.97922 Transcript_43384/m.97922 type:complete len:308 (-) Transcript_43384:256-1179(-)
MALPSTASNAASVVLSSHWQTPQTFVDVPRVQEMPQSQLCAHSCLTHPQSLGGGFLRTQLIGSLCFLPSKMRGYLSHALTFASLLSWERYCSTRCFSCSELSNCTTTVSSTTSSAIMPSSGFGLFTAKTSPKGAAPGLSLGAPLTRQCVQTRSPFRNVLRSSRCSFSLLPAGVDAPSPPGGPRFSGVLAAPPLGPAARFRAMRTSSLPEMMPRSMFWSSSWMSSKPSMSSTVWMTRVVFRARMKVLKMHRAWYHMITTCPSSPLPSISTRRPMRSSPFSMLRTPPCAWRSRHSRSRHIALPAPPRVA